MASERPLPVARDAERLVLGQVVVFDAMNDLRTVLTAEDFSLERDRKIWDACCAIYDAGGRPDRVSVATELERRGQLESVDGLSYLVSLDDDTPKLVNVDGWVAALKDKASLRRLMLNCQSLYQRAASGLESAADLISAAGRVWMEMPEVQTRKDFLTAEDVVRATGVEQMLRPRRDRGIPLPWPWLNAMLCGLHAEELLILGARTSIGKTSAALQMAAMACQKGHRGAIFSLEMSNESLIRRMVNQVSGVEPAGRRDTPLTAAEMKAQRDALSQIMEWPLHFDDSASRNVVGVHAALRKLTNRYGQLGFVVVDHLHILRGSGRYDKRNQEVSDVARSLKLMAKEFRCCFVVPAQLSRPEDKTKPKEPTIHELRESGEVEENANTVVFLHVPPCESQEYKPAKIMVAKQREGPRDVANENFGFYPKLQKFAENNNVEY